MSTLCAFGPTYIYCPPCSSLSPPVKNAEYLQQAALEEYGPDLHMALRSRRDELLYLRKLPEILFPYILPPKALDCRYHWLLTSGGDRSSDRR